MIDIIRRARRVRVTRSDVLHRTDNETKGNEDDAMAERVGQVEWQERDFSSPANACFGSLLFLEFTFAVE